MMGRDETLLVLRCPEWECGVKVELQASVGVGRFGVDLGGFQHCLQYMTKLYYKFTVEICLI